MWSRGQEFSFGSSVLCSLALKSFRENYESITSPHRYGLNSQIDRPLYFWGGSRSWKVKTVEMATQILKKEPVESHDH